MYIQWSDNYESFHQQSPWKSLFREFRPVLQTVWCNCLIQSGKWISRHTLYVHMCMVEALLGAALQASVEIYDSIRKLAVIASFQRAANSDCPLLAYTRFENRMINPLSNIKIILVALYPNIHSCPFIHNQLLQLCLIIAKKGIDCINRYNMNMSLSTSQTSKIWCAVIIVGEYHNLKNWFYCRMFLIHIFQD